MTRWQCTVHVAPWDDLEPDAIHVELTADGYGGHRKYAIDRWAEVAVEREDDGSIRFRFVCDSNSTVMSAALGSMRIVDSVLSELYEDAYPSVIGITVELMEGTV